MAKDEPKTVTLDLDTLNQLIDAKVKTGVAEAQARQAADGIDFEKAMKLVRGGDKPAAKVWSSDLCVSPLTGCTFKCKLMASRTSAQGRVIDLEEYTYPEGVDVPQSQGGKMPDGHLKAPPEKHAHWKYWEFMRRDLGEFVGKPFTRYLLKTEHDKRVALDAAPVAAE